MKAENYLQHAEHYYRVIRALQPAQPPPGAEQGAEGDFEGDQPAISDYQDRRPDDAGAETSHSGGEGEQPMADRNPSEFRPRQGGEPRPNGADENGEQQRDARGDDRQGRRRHRPRRPFREGEPQGGRAQGEVEGGQPEPADTDEVPA